MLHSLLFSLVAFSNSSTSLALKASDLVSIAQQDDTEGEQRLEAAGNDSAKLWSLHEWCKSHNKDRESRAC